MRLNARWLSVILILFHAVFSCISPLQAQSFRFKTYDSNVGLPQNFVYSLSQDQNGYLWMGTGEGLVKYNGLEFAGFNHADSLAEDFITVMHVSKDGTLWIGHNNGDITLYENEEFIPLRISETKSPIAAIISNGNGHAWAVSQNEGLISIDQKAKSYRLVTHKKLRRKLFYTLASDEDQLLAGTSEGMVRITPAGTDSIAEVSGISKIPMTNINCIVPRKGINGDFWVGTEDNGFFLYSKASDRSRHIVDNSLCLKFDIQWENIRDIEEEPNGNLLLATWGNGVIKLFYAPESQSFVDSYNFTTENGLSNNYVRDILCDRESNYWFATYGGGTSVLTGEEFVFYNLETIGFEKSKVLSTLLNDSTLWFGLETGLIKTDPYCFTDFEYYDAAFGLPEDDITGIHKMQDGTLFLGTANNGLYYKLPGSTTFTPWYYSHQVPDKKIRDLAGKDRMIYLATYGGFFTIDTETRKAEHLTTGKGLPHNNINFVEVDKDNQVWIGPRNSGICKVNNGSIEMHKISDSPIDVYDMAQTSDSAFWLATQGQGIIKYSSDSIEHYSIAQGLAKNFCYSIESDINDRLWIAHHPGLSMFNTKTGEIETYGHEENMGADFYQILKDSDQTLWFSSANGTVHYFPEKHKKNDIAPALHFTKILISGEQYSSNQEINLPYPYGENYKFRFNFMGISFRNPDEVTYRYRLIKNGEQSESEWIDLGNTNFREYDFLPSGSYELKIEAVNADGYTADPISVSFTIATPFWKKPWFFLLLAAVLIYTVYLIIVARERKLKRQKELLQKEVDLQTIQLREQKAEIERKNRDITDSINYAKTIQSSILPPLDVLKTRFPESYVFFAPRDIVSGDFYWFYKTKNHFIVTCADCTGHGVPGAFMSMIGSTLLNDIVKRKDVNSPADLLERLDFEIKVLLQNSKNKDNTKDGMDISVVEVENTGTRVRVASAKRPVYLYLNNELTIYKGNRRSIGDSLVDDDTPFVNIEYNATEGDLIYLFSDGYTDQFGGPREKKFMKVGVKNMLEEIHDLPMDRQYESVRSRFHEWKGDLEQVDDVIFMGLKL
ncbi:two-component regulator propeller domain-containing protein [Marinilabilia salmonicolor]|jgi:ligand-binding sensor domain-containing protein/serine phosphatase RsbU (regulator of sigma subunit)|uniref:Serine phosphatase RsbU (Regulator of sigma subunit) n=1 Tax=Marinilabilia salmonicolor TaxID=989 RepID=A0A368VDZ9_9BACT|nr:two-component regulator propeller domain-containing protein [Marinilabilia salmonicolor]RCW39487.1 serine phosphatase RsbU (regulator of sigma subunit) [Marinilabilia salmonicolor]